MTTLTAPDPIKLASSVTRIVKMGPAKAKRRAPRACIHCRSRKVRCITVPGDGPCTNCRADNKDCFFVPRSRVSRALARIDLEQTAVPESCSLQASSGDSLRDEVESFMPGSNKQPPASIADSLLAMDMKTSSDASMFQRRSSPLLTCGTLPIASPPVRYPTPSWLYSPITEPTASSMQCAKARSDLCDPYASYYPFLGVSNLSSLPTHDLNFLVSQGCFAVPQRGVLDHFIREYFLRVHPMLPVLDEADVWAKYHLQTPMMDAEDRISLLVLQGILFVSCSFVAPEIIKALNFRDIHEAKVTFYKRAKLLYDLGAEKSPVAIAQASLLLSHSHLMPLSHVHGSCSQLGTLWLSIAIHHARSAGAHRYHSCSTGPDSLYPKRKCQNTLKRLWWCCIIRDRIMPLTSRRNIQITRTNFDFDNAPSLGTADLAAEIHKSYVYDAAEKQYLIRLLEKLVDLCLALTDILAMIFPLQDDPSRLLPHHSVESGRILGHKVTLKRWYSGLSQFKSAAKSKEGTSSGSPKSHRHAVVLFRNLIEMYYHSARFALCHYEILLHGSLASQSSNSTATTLDENIQELQTASLKVIDSLKELVQLQLACYLPISAVGCTAFPLALLIIDVNLLGFKKNNANAIGEVVQITSSKQQQLNVLIQAMKTYRPRYDGVDWVVKAVRYITSLAQHCPISRRPTQSKSAPTPPVASWAELLKTQPIYYLRLAMTLDMSISSGKFPDESDFPTCLRGILNASFGAIGSPFAGNMITPITDHGSKKQEAAPLDTERVVVDANLDESVQEHTDEPLLAADLMEWDIMHFFDEEPNFLKMDFFPSPNFLSPKKRGPTPVDVDWDESPIHHGSRRRSSGSSSNKIVTVGYDVEKALLDAWSEMQDCGIDPTAVELVD